MARRYPKKLPAAAAAAAVLAAALGVTYAYVLPAQPEAGAPPAADAGGAGGQAAPGARDPAGSHGGGGGTAGWDPSGPRAGAAGGSGGAAQPPGARDRVEGIGSQAGSRGDRHPSSGVYRGSVTGIVDGDTLDVGGARIRLALVDAPEAGEDGYGEAKSFVGRACPAGSPAVYDPDDGQPEGSHGRVIGKVWCYGHAAEAPRASVNAMLVERGHAEIVREFCKKSEFGRERWARDNGC